MLDEHETQQRPLRMQSVFGLVQHDGVRAVNHLVGDFLAAVGGEAVQDDDVVSGFVHQVFVDLELGEVSAAPNGLFLLAGADPDVGVDHVRAFHRPRGDRW